MPRRTAAIVEHDAAQALISALDSLGVAASITSTESADDDARSDFSIEVAGEEFDLEVISVVTAALGEQLTRRRTQRALPLLVVADRIAADAKRSLRSAGVNFFDRRGELRIIEPPIIIDAVVPSARSTTAGSAGPLASQVAKEVAIACLVTPDQPHGVREVARYIERAPSAVSTSMADLREEGLLTSGGEPLIPDLFHELVTVWRRRSVPLAELPDPTGGPVNARLGLGLDDPQHSTGWALTDTVAASSWGIPIVARGDYPPDFHVPTESALRAARSLLGEATDAETRACTAAVAPVRLACLRRFDHSQTSGERWPVANHIVVALDIAQDKARGLEALEQWQPEGIARAW
jgi:hypothetical protein